METTFHINGVESVREVSGEETQGLMRKNKERLLRAGDRLRKLALSYPVTTSLTLTYLSLYGANATVGYPVISWVFVYLWAMGCFATSTIIFFKVLNFIISE